MTSPPPLQPVSTLARMTRAAVREDTAMTTATVTRSGTETRRRSHVVPLRLDDDELADLNRLSDLTGISRQQILRAGLALFTATETP